MIFVSFAINVSENYLDERKGSKSKSTFAIFFLPRVLINMPKCHMDSRGGLRSFL